MVAGKDAFKPGEAKNSWSTGTALWNFYAITQYIFGIRPDYDGLLIDPCIPNEWKELKVTRKFRVSIYVIHILNPDSKSKGVKELYVDDILIQNNIIPIFNAIGTHQVKVIMG